VTQERLVGLRESVASAAAVMDGKSLINLEGRVPYYDLSLLRVLEMYLDDESLRSREKDKLDQACKEVQSLFIDYHLAKKSELIHPTMININYVSVAGGKIYYSMWV
jgi:hypothetical protein